MIKYVNSSEAKRFMPFLLLFFICYFFPLSQSQAQNFSPMVGLGDSIGEGVQSADSSVRTQQHTYLNQLSKQIDVDFTLPWIITNPLGVVGSTVVRSRLFPDALASNLAVSGADVHSLINEQADALSPEEIESETDLVLFPRIGSQLDIAESIDPSLIVCWIGNNDVLSAAISFDQLDASQMTPVLEFKEDFQEIVDRLIIEERTIVFGNIPDVANIGFLMDRQDLINFLGSDYGLPEGDFTSMVVMLLIRLGFDDGSLISDPDFVLDSREIELIRNRIDVFNQIIEKTTSDANVPVADMNNWFDEISVDPIVIDGISLTNRFLGGIFSLDGVHPSDIAHAYIANFFIHTLNTHYNVNIPLIPAKTLLNIFYTDPFVDKDGDNQVKGRPGAGLLETLGPYLGISGDSNDFEKETVTFREQSDLRNEFIKQYLLLQGKDIKSTEDFNKKDAIEAFKIIFGLEKIGY